MNSAERKSRRKRNLPPEFNDTTSKTEKKPKTAKMSQASIDELKQLLINSHQEIDNKITSSNASIESKLTSISSKIETDLSTVKNAIDDFTCEIRSDIQSVQKQLNEHGRRLNNSEDDIQRVKYSGDLRLNGFTPSNDENLYEIFKKVSIEIGCEGFLSSNTPVIERIPIRNRATGTVIASPTNILFALPSKNAIEC